MKCPICNSSSKIVDARAYDEKAAKKRRRECLNCGLRWNTIEVEFDWYDRARYILEKLEGLNG